MNLTSNRKIAVIVYAIIITVGVTSIATLILVSLDNSAEQKDDVPVSGVNVTVSGTVDSRSLSQPFLTSLQTIEFTDTQTGANVSFRFPFPAQGDNPVGNYSVTLQDGHTYSVDLSYYTGPRIGGMIPHTDNLGTYTVQAPTGTTSITQDFPDSTYHP
jgi:hypothetical protein